MHGVGSWGTCRRAHIGSSSKYPASRAGVQPINRGRAAIQHVCAARLLLRYTACVCVMALMGR